MSRYSYKIESVGLRRCPHYRNLIEKVTCTDVRTTNISQRLPHKMAENDMKKLRHCHPMYRPHVTYSVTEKGTLLALEITPFITSRFYHLSFNDSSVAVKSVPIIETE